MSDDATTTAEPKKTFGQIGFEAYNDAKGGVTYDGKPIPPWTAVGKDVREAWQCAAEAILETLLDDADTVAKARGLHR